jgi:hypothetical protein
MTMRGVDTWAKLVKLPNPDIKILCEVKPTAYYECGSDWASEGSSTYSHACIESGVSHVTFDDSTLVEEDSVADVKSTAGTWYFDFYDQRVYVHGPTGENLSSGSTTNIVMVFVYKDFASAVYHYGNREYRPLVRQDSFPAMDLAVDDIVEGMYRFNFSSFSLNNDGWFDTAVESYIWTNRVVIIKIGGEALPYSEYQTFFVGRISDFSVSDELVVFTLKDMRVGSYAQIPLDHYWIVDYPDMDPDDEGKSIPIFYGIKANITPICIDTTAGTGGKWKICASREIKEITQVMKNKKVLVENTDYSVDLANGEFTLIHEGFNKDRGHTLSVTAEGFVDGSDNLIEKGGAIAKDILQTYLGWSDAELDLTSFTTTDSLRTAALDIYLDTDSDSREVLQTIGRSIVAFFSPTEDGKLSFMAYEPTVEDGTLELFDEDFYADWKVIKDDSWIRNKVQLSYGQNPTSDEYLTVEVSNDAVLYKYGVRDTLSIITYLRNESDAENIAQGVLDMVSKPITVFSSTFGLKGFILFPTRKVVVTRERAADLTGEFAAKVFRIKQVVKNPTSETTQVIGQDDLQTLGAIFCYVCYSCQTCYTQESGCTLCYSCQNCNTTQEGCLTCVACQLCNTTEGGCQTCDSCEACDSCEQSVGECETCQVNYSCFLCVTCQSSVTTCSTCQLCYTCAICVACQVNVTSCEACQLCNMCDSCDTCQVQDATCETCQNCYYCQTVYSPCPGSCDICNVCDSCYTCQSGVVTCPTCQVCNSCQVWYSCSSCDTCELCYSAQHPTGCAVCNTCQYCVSAQDCISCDVCNACQGSCYTCEICVSSELKP